MNDDEKDALMARALTSVINTCDAVTKLAQSLACLVDKWTQDTVSDSE